MKRVLLMVTAALIMAAMLAVMSTPTFGKAADNTGTQSNAFKGCKAEYLRTVNPTATNKEVNAACR